MWVIPEQSRPLPPARRDAHLVLELAAGMDVDEHVVAPSLRRYDHPVVMQVRRIIRKRIPEADPQGVSESHSEQRRHISAVVEKPGECEITELYTAWSRGERRLEHPVF